MKCNRMDELLPDYLLGDTDETTKAEVRSHLEECAGCREEVESLDFVWRKLSAWPEEKAPEGMRARFHGMLEGYKEGLLQPSRRWRARASSWAQGFSPGRLAFQAGLALVFLIVGLTSGYLLSVKGRGNVELAELRTELHHMRQLVALSLLQQQSASERLQGVSWSSRMTSPDEKVISALLDALSYDPNTNVRLASVDALSNFSDRADVRQGLIRALTRQNSPLVQIALIDLMVQIRERQSATALRQLAEDETMHQVVRQRAERGLRELS